MSILKKIAKSITNCHISGDRPSIILFATPRGGSTWFMQLITSQPGFRYCDEPLDIRSEEIRKYSGIQSWKEMYADDVNEKYKKYFPRLLDGSLNFRNPNPLRPGYRFLTNRVVLKVIHGGVDRINWFKNEFDVKILYCLRHPIAVALSRKELPFLQYYLDSGHKNNFTNEQNLYAANIIKNGTHLEKGVLAWCLHNSLPLKDITPDWAIATYEQAVIEPAPLIDYLCDKLDLSRPDLMHKQLNVPSPVIRESDEETKKILSGCVNDRSELIRKWKKNVSDDDEKKLMEILDVFKFDAYSFGSILPYKKYWVGEDYEHIHKKLVVDNYQKCV